MSDLRQKRINLFDVILGFNEKKAAYFRAPNWSDKLLAVTVLRLIPPFISPNMFTIFRLISIPFIVFLFVNGEFVWGTVLFILAAVSDALDGAKARTTGYITVWGTIMDPIADKLLIGTVSVLLVSSYISLALATIIVFIEIVLVASAFYRFRGHIVPAKWAGKIKMVLQSVGLIILLFYILFPVPLLLLAATYTLYAAVAFGILSLFVYRSI